MVYYPSVEQSVPLIVVGPPRSGTRFVTDVLNCVPGITLQGELNNYVMDMICQIVQKCDIVYGPDAVLNRKRYYDGTIRDLTKNWDATKRDFMFSAWANLGKVVRRDCAPDCRYYGYKTPWHEFHFDFYNTFFHPVKPRYIYCVRQFKGHFLSVTARWPERSIRFVAQKYVRSVRQARYMKQQRPDEVMIFVLNDYKQQGIQYLRQRLFEPLGITDVAEAEHRAEQGAVNTAGQLGFQKKANLTMLQKLFLKLYPHPLREFDALRRDFC